jgi:hypothetical protein
MAEIPVPTAKHRATGNGMEKRGRLRSLLRARTKDTEGQQQSPGDKLFEEQLLDECGAMLRYASTQGRDIPPRAAAVVRELDNMRSDDSNQAWKPEPEDAARLATAHRDLRKVVEPATPKSITLQNQQAPSTAWLALFGAVKVVRVMMLLALIFLLAFLVLLPTAVGDPVAAVTGTGSERNASWGEGFLNALYIVFAAGLGVLFSQLYRINRQISRGRYDPAEDAVHMTTVVLGLIAGVVLAFLLSDVLDDANGSSQTFSQPLLALLGGFSAPAVHNIVSRLVDTVGTLVGGDPREQAAAEVQEAVTRVTAAAEEDRRRIAEAAEQDRIRLTARALRIREDAEREGASESLRSEIGTFVSDLLPGTKAGKAAPQ